MYNRRMRLYPLEKLCALHKSVIIFLAKDFRLGQIHRDYIFCVREFLIGEIQTLIKVIDLYA